MKKFGQRCWLWWEKIKSDSSGQGLVEYGLILALIAVVVIGLLSNMGSGLKNMFTNVSNFLNK